MRRLCTFVNSPLAGTPCLDALAGTSGLINVYVGLVYKMAPCYQEMQDGDALAGDEEAEDEEAGGTN